MEAENAVLSRLSGNWHRRAAVRRDEPPLDAFYEVGRPDYPVALTPLHRHPGLSGVDPVALDKALYLAGLAFHRHTMVIEQHIVGPTFQRALDDWFRDADGSVFQSTVLQAAVDEQYHTLMHFNAAATMRRNRALHVRDSDIPLPHLIARHRDRREAQPLAWQRDLVSLAFTTAVEISIDAYLVLVGRDPDIQPVTRATAALHWRDEKCHAAVSEELAQYVFLQLDETQRDFFMEQLAYATRCFAEQDFSAWHRIAELAGIRDGRRLIDECAEIPEARHLIRDNSGINRLWAALDRLADGRYGASPGAGAPVGASR
ncbi:hypothetical protein AQI95_19620 [Streptomyces yokosukanensis]|uniref:N-oxidase n=1 Tax=Streptomyces yokosukanensis TaxID=67386 RepID=A0A101P428_9ACTN|nr:diiron oxygenase [Streptomyces yokosukanensis]KUN04550.1 hypothetical protein AQI95_19620 [Streptomyces yokosukanensis]